MPSETIKAKITKKAGNGKGFILEGHEGWFNANDKVVPFLAKIAEGKVVEVSYFKKGVKREVTMIKEISGTTEVSKEEIETVKPHCTVCGKDLKDDKYPTCWDCKDKAPQKEEKKTEEPKKEKTYTNYDKIGYGSTEDIAGKEVGCAANCAAQILSGAGVGEPTEVLERFRTLFNGILEHIRANK